MDLLAKALLLSVVFVGAMATHVSATSHMDSSADCSKQYRIDPRGQFRRDVDRVLDELKAETPVDGNFEHLAESNGWPKVFGRASCFSSLTTNVEGCTSCLDKAIEAIKSQCRNSVRASAGSAAAGCSVRYDNVRIKV